MTTFGTLIDEVSLALSGYTMRQDTMTSLTNAINATDLTVTLQSVENIGQGIIEIDDELLYVQAVNRQSSTVTIAPWGRGYMGSTAASHAAGAKVSASPTFPRKAIANAINDTINAVYPDLFGVSACTFTATPAVTSYSLPADLQNIISVTYEEVGPSKEWIPIRRYDLDGMTNATAFTTGNSITIRQYVTPGRTVNVFYAKEPTNLSTSSDNFVTVTGLPASTIDVIKYGAQHRLITNIEPGRLSMTSPEADYNSARVTFGSGTNTAKYLYALYQQRLAEESKKLKGKYGIRIHYSR